MQMTIFWLREQRRSSTCRRDLKIKWKLRNHWILVNICRGKKSSTPDSIRFYRQVAHFAVNWPPKVPMDPLNLSGPARFDWFLSYQTFLFWTPIHPVPFWGFRGRPPRALSSGVFWNSAQFGTTTKSHRANPLKEIIADRETFCGKQIR